ncbi:TetR/AcrR family transcriptional regulator [Actinomyces trachealis]|uniref:TetR/AcrR family transcriptional regulator n=1 Tax=Actinomyces trachealis TaxID=2763540 RepID=UPI001892BB6F|nr:TetR/AcrR family transcriptional regulator [Actinomyces trachealis]
MPHQTFFNLPEGKRCRLMGALKAEFAAHPYQRASVDRVAATAGVSKGSFYQYFKDKQDAYTYLLQDVVGARIGLAGTPLPENSLQEVLTALIKGNHDFHERDPQGWAVLARSLADDAPTTLASAEALPAEWRHWAVKAITSYQKNGELRDDVAPATAAWLLERVLLGMPQHIMSRFQLAPEAAVENCSAFDHPEIAAVTHDVVAMLTAALLAPEAPADQVPAQD